MNRRRTLGVAKAPNSPEGQGGTPPEALYPWLYLKGISTGDFGEALQALLGPEARGLSATTITRLKAVWEQEYQDWRSRC